MTMIISHRGNMNGPNLGQENKPEYIEKALDAGFCAEIDFWNVNGEPFLGHDGPTYPVDEKWLFKFQTMLFVHCKQISGLILAKRLGFLRHFFHQNDDCALTSDGWIWTYPRSTTLLTDISIPVVLNRNNLIWPWNDLAISAGICTDDCLWFDSLLNQSYVG